MSVTTSTHFKWHELVCHDCGLGDVDPKLLEALEALRNLGPEMIRVLDCCRCEKHNVEVGGVGKSEHLFWLPNDPLSMGKPTRAADVRIQGLTVKAMYLRALQVPAFVRGGVGVYDSNFLHLDIRPSGPARWARVNGKYVGLELSGLVGAEHV